MGVTFHCTKEIVECVPRSSSPQMDKYISGVIVLYQAYFDQTRTPINLLRLNPNLIRTGDFFWGGGVSILFTREPPVSALSFQSRFFSTKMTFTSSTRVIHDRPVPANLSVSPAFVWEHHDTLAGFTPAGEIVISNANSKHFIALHK